MKRYAHDGEYEVAVDEAALQQRHYAAKGRDILAKTIWTGSQASDPLLATRSFIRHDPDAVARELMRIYFA